MYLAVVLIVSTSIDWNFCSVFAYFGFSSSGSNTSELLASQHRLRIWGQEFCAFNSFEELRSLEIARTVSNWSGTPFQRISFRQKIIFFMKLQTWLRHLPSNAYYYWSHLNMLLSSLQYLVWMFRETSLYAVFLSAISRICDWELSFFLEPILQFAVILGLFICEHIF